MSNNGTVSGVREGVVACLAPLTVPMLVGFSGLCGVSSLHAGGFSE